MLPIADNKILMGILNTVKLYCKQKDKGCKEILAFDQYEKHMELCGQCKMCSATVIKENMFTHFATNCPNYVLNCAFCQESLPRKDMYAHRCYQMHVSGIFQKKEATASPNDKKSKPHNDYYFTGSRVANLSSLKNIYAQL